MILDDQKFESLLERISGYNHEKAHQRLSGKRLTGTTRWFFDHPDFKAWFIEKTIPSLWCSGKSKRAFHIHVLNAVLICTCFLVGSGKTMIAFVFQYSFFRYYDLIINRTAVIEAAKYEPGSPTVFFYCEGDDHAGFDAFSVLSSFIKQLCEVLHRMSRPHPEDIVRDIGKFFGHNKVKADLDDLKNIFSRFFVHAPDTIYVLDGVDALDQKNAKYLLGFFRSLFLDSRNQQGSRLLLLSRDQVPGYINMNTLMPGIRHISTSANVMQDIKTYIESSIIDKNVCRKLTDDPVLLEEIRHRLLAESSGMYAIQSAKIIALRE